MTSADPSAESESRRLRVVGPARTGTSVPRPPESPLGNLPLELSSFVGRGREVAEIERLLVDRRLLSLCGPGGCGKTRLALAVAQDVIEEFEGGVWWVELAPLAYPDLVPRAVASALGVREAPDLSPTEVLVKHLTDRKTLLVLDNCEHLIEACADLADTLLRACPGLRILTTSREPLRVGGETNFLVPSLSLPDDLRHSPPPQSLSATRRSASSLSGQRPSMRASPLTSGAFPRWPGYVAGSTAYRLP